MGEPVVFGKPRGGVDVDNLIPEEHMVVRKRMGLHIERAVLFEELRKWRAGVAKRQGGPAFVVFGDADLTSR
jgi:superfamily II DNA helicase RecQ